MPNRGLSLVVCLGLSACTAAWSQQYTIAPLAGNGSSGFADGAGSAAQFNNPNAIFVDSKGVLYVADTTNNRIRTVTNGTAATIAGTGTAGNSGNGSSATAATVNNPGGIMVDSAGTVYIGDTNSNVVRKISNGNISVFAGSGNAGYSGDNNTATNADLQGPTGVTIDSAGNVYIADTGNSLIRKVDKNGTITSYIGATGPTAGRLNHPTGVWIDSAGTLFVADTGNRRIIKFANNVFAVVAGTGVAGFSGDNGPALTATFNNPTGIAGDAAGNLYVADSNNGRIRKITPDGKIFTIAGRGGSSYSGDNGPALSAGLSFPRGVTVDSAGNVYIADTQNHVIRMLTPTLPSIVSGGVGNAASFAAKLSPGSLATVFGTGFGTTNSQPDEPLPATIGGVSVLVNGKASPIYYLSPTQINFQVPWSSPTSGTASVVVSVAGGNSNTISVPFSAAAPGLFYLPGGAAIVQNQDYSLNDTSNPAARGSTIIAYLTGSGPLSLPQTDGVSAPGSTLVTMTAPYSVKIGSAAAQVSFAGLAPGYIGLVQMNIVVPTTLTPGTYPLSVTIAGDSSNSATIAVK
ncbi:MAG TPA: IPT/TIG domain-containing protein [Candidatus Solibacter sp.]|nr:IPT/TIG domain-containing protein [Candidatus Solibacter sp.]